MIVHEMKEYALSLCGDKTVTDVYCGNYFTFVQLSDGSCGISFDYPSVAGIRENCNHYAGNTIGRPASDLVELADSLSLLEASLGHSTINALTAAGRDQFPEGAVEDYVEPKSTDIVGVIGNFGPMFHRFNEICKEVRVFDFNPQRGQFPAWAEPMLLPECDIVMITGATLVNKSLDQVLACCTKAREIVLIGPSAVHTPEILKKHGITLLASSEITDPEACIRLIKEGAYGADVLREATRSYYCKL